MWFALTPSDKHIAKAVARGNRLAVAIQCLKEPVTRNFLLRKISYS